MIENSVLNSRFDAGITTLTLNRPEQYNALSDTLLDALLAALNQIANDDRVRAVILAANGKAFCAGHDLKQMRACSEKNEHKKLFQKCSEVMMKIIHLPQPVIAKVQGMATAAGCQLVATCDLAVSSVHAKFAVSGINVGLFCATPAVALSRNIPRKKALEMLMTGDFIDANTAMSYGLVNQVVMESDLDQAVNDLAAKITCHPRRVVNLGKAAFYRQLNQDLPTAYQITSEAISSNMMLEETLEGIDAFIEKRNPNWD